ncbi:MULTISPECIES: hypothetical protein [Pseudomonas syringae group]|uniref:hypothetical protein n=1 Tax=Pseudomonas syringae group TaxID=136849 RepID=UPI000291307F|nr:MULTISPECIES: hypothetical protein [Pseudomonas syringae group]EKN48517.1 hypothetical protein AAI_01547 [Pseudomonas viridiflava UASWS0038]KPL65862.1 hypothetical protein PVFL_05590 [Pseudomonas viridiflava]OAG83254.1 hypothetical protein AO065_10755 [Pseudomonas viridiflava]
MPRITLTDVVDIISKSGTPKATKVNQIKYRQAYSPQTDFYKPLREWIVSIHQKNHPKNQLTDVLKFLTDEKKIKNYPKAISGYERWWGRKVIIWNSSFSAVYSYQNIDIGINPELGLVVDGVPHLIKLYLKDEPLHKLRVDVILALMQSALSSGSPANCKMAILDVRNSKLFCANYDSASLEKLMRMVNAELAYVATLWDQI